uniref:Putative reverse transcriptase domain-containing protein n=1 Tax=Tanacetum cinerariifolium TaxID=118510 RepID=A0A6L2KDM2_TANCI|nr:putative reverse transcriptase domain-containing protein [Tanacetum cinerariifolium]
MAALIISISSNVSVESVGSSFSRVILIGSISVEVSVAPEVGVAAVASPAGVLELDTHSSSEADPLESSTPPVSVTPMVSPFLFSDDSESDTKIPERHVSHTPNDAMLTRWRSRVASPSPSPTTSFPEIPTTPILPATSTIVTPSSEFLLALDRGLSPLEVYSTIYYVSTMTSESSAMDSSFESSTRPSYKRCRSLAAIIISSIHTTRALVPSRSNLLPPRKRDIKGDVTAVKVVVDRDIEAGIDAGIGMKVDVRIDVEDKVESSDRGTMEVGLDVVSGIDIHEEDIETERRELEVRNMIAGGERASLPLVAYEATRAANALEGENQSQNGCDGDNGNGGNRNGENGNGRNRNRHARPVARECTYHDFMMCQPLNFKGTEGVVRLIRWFEKMETVFHISNCPEKYQVLYATCTLLNNALTWWNSHKRTIGTEGFQELTMMCTKMVPEEEDRVEKFIGGLLDNIKGNVIAVEPMRLKDAVRIAKCLMDQKLKGYAVKNAKNKRSDMDWLANHHAVIMCDEKIVRIPYGDEVLIVQGDKGDKGEKSKLSIISYTKTQKYIKRGCLIFLAQVTKKKTEDKSKEKRIKEVPIVRDFLKVFLEYFPGLPSTRQVEFQIDLVPSAAPIARATYRLAPSEMQELSTQLQELYDTGFIRPIQGDKGDKGEKSKLSIISYTKTQKYIKRGCLIFLAQVTKKKTEDKSKEKRIKEVPIVRDFLKVFLEYFPGLPSTRQVEFQIDLVPSAAPIARATYRLAPSEMQELSTQLQELYDTGFIRPREVGYLVEAEVGDAQLTGLEIVHETLRRSFRLTSVFKLHEIDRRATSIGDVSRWNLRVMSSPNYPTIDIENAFSSNFSDYTTASPNDFPATPRNISSDFLENSNNDEMPPVFSPFYNNPYLKDMQAFYAKESPIAPPDPITPPIILTPSAVLPPSLLFDP